MDWSITFYLFTHQLMNICVISTLWLLRIMLIFCECSINFLRCLPRSGIAGSYGSPFGYLAEELPKYCSKWLDCFIFLASVYEDSNFSTFLPTVVTVRLFDSSHPSRCEMVSQYGFDFHFLMINVVHQCVCLLFIYPLWRIVYSTPSSILKKHLSFITEVEELFT